MPRSLRLMNKIDASVNARSFRQTREAPKSDPLALPERPRGYGLRQKMAEMSAPNLDPQPVFSPSEEDSVEEQAPTQTSPQIIINTGASSGASSQIDTLATWISKAPDNQRNDRMKSAVELLHLSAANDSERERFARELDQKLAALGIKKSFSIFETLDNFLK